MDSSSIQERIREATRLRAVRVEEFGISLGKLYASSAPAIDQVRRIASLDVDASRDDLLEHLRSQCQDVAQFFDNLDDADGDIAWAFENYPKALVRGFVQAVSELAAALERDDPEAP